MAKILVTGGTGFVAAHIISVLLSSKASYVVVTTVRSCAKHDALLAAFPGVPREQLCIETVPDIAQENAFDEILSKHKDISAVIHTASPFHDKFEDPKELLVPAIEGTINILKAVKRLAPTVSRIVLTSSFAAMVTEDPKQAPEVYDETCWNPVTWEDATTKRSQAYRGSKTFAERAAWDFVRDHRPSFDLVSICPPVVYGPIVHGLSSLQSMNTSNQRVLDFIEGKYRQAPLPPTGTLMWVDVRDLAEAHVRAFEVTDAGGERFFAVGGHYSNKTMVDAIGATHPDLKSILSPDSHDELESKRYTFDNSKIRETFGIEFRSLERSMADTVESLLALGANTSGTSKESLL